MREEDDKRVAHDQGRNTRSSKKMSGPFGSVSRIGATGMVETLTRSNESIRQVRVKGKGILKSVQPQSLVEGGDGEGETEMRDDVDTGTCETWGMHLPNLWNGILSDSTSSLTDEYDDIQITNTCNNCKETTKTSSESIGYDEEECIGRKEIRGNPRFLSFPKTNEKNNCTKIESKRDVTDSNRIKRKRKGRHSDGVNIPRDLAQNASLPYQIGIAVSFTITAIGLLSMFVYFLIQAVSTN